METCFNLQQTSAISSGITKAIEGFLLKAQEFGKNIEHQWTAEALWDHCWLWKSDEKSILEEEN